MQDVRRADKPADATPIEEDGHGYHANSFMAVPITQKDRPDAPDLENVVNVRQTQSPSIPRSTHDTRIQHPSATQTDETMKTTA